MIRVKSYLCSKCMNDSSIAEYHHDKRQRVADNPVGNSDDLRSSAAHVGREPSAGSIYDISGYSGECDLE